MASIFDILTIDDFTASDTQLVKLTGDKLDVFNSVKNEVIEDILKDLLGDDLYLGYKEAIEGGSPETKWTDLRDGEIYTDSSSGKRVEYKGLKDMLRYFIFYEWMISDRTLNTRSGNVNRLDENAERTKTAELNIEKTNAYNKGVDLYGYRISLGNISITSNLRIYSRVYRGLDGYRNDINKYKLKGNCFNYITEKNNIDSGTYPNWDFSDKDIINVYGI